MNSSLITKLRCPIDGGALRCIPIYNSQCSLQEKKTDLIKSGILVNPRKKIFYPLHNYVAVLLVFPTSFHDWFIRQNYSTFRKYSKLSSPNLRPQIGEAIIQKTFTEQWRLTKKSRLTFGYNQKQLKKFNQDVLLHGIQKRNSIRSILNCGCGIGGETLALNSIFSPDLVVAVDLNFNLLDLGEKFLQYKNINFIIASLFHLPFSINSFDFVYSQGVLHHTFCTKTAFNSVRRYVKRHGYLFIWVYAHEDKSYFKNRTDFKGKTLHILSQLNIFMEDILRPLLWRMPPVLRGAIVKLLSIVLHPLVKTRALNKSEWRLTNTEHGLRDLLCHRFAYRHCFNEVLEWFENSKFKIQALASPAACRKLFGKRAFGIGILGKAN